MKALEQQWQQQLSQLAEQGLLRQRRLLPQASVIDDFSSNDYLGFGMQESAFVEGRTENPSERQGSGASPLVSGYLSIHQQLEQALCQQTGHQAAMLFCSGFAANMALMKTLFEAKQGMNASQFVLADKLVHASLIDGLQHSGVRFKRFKHNDLTHAQQLANKQAPTALITESVFSMDGDLAPLMELKQLADQHDALLIVDDAHGFATQQAICDASLCDIQVITFGKALGGQGAAILGSQLLIDYLVATCRGYIYSTALSPLMTQLVLQRLTMPEALSAAQQQLQQNIRYFIEHSQHLPMLRSSTAIQPVLVGDNQQVVAIGQWLGEQGILVGVIRSPTVPHGQARLRVTLTAAHTSTQIDRLIAALTTAFRC